MRTVILAATALCSVFCAQAPAVTLNEGESFYIGFSSLTYMGYSGATDINVVRVKLDGDLLGLGEVVDVSVFESEVGALPARSETVSGDVLPQNQPQNFDVGFIVPLIWRDLQGAVLFAALKGSFTISEVKIEVHEGGHRYEADYNLRVTETPIPGALPLFASVLGLGGFFGYRRKRKAAPAIA